MDSMGRSNGGDCKAGCFNHPKNSISLTADWAQYQVTFVEAAGGSAKVKGLLQEIVLCSVRRSLHAAVRLVPGTLSRARSNAEVCRAIDVLAGNEAFDNRYQLLLVHLAGPEVAQLARGIE